MNILNSHLNIGETFMINYFHEHDKTNCVYHTHEFIEICYVARGCGYHIINNTEYKVQRGDLFIITHDIPHVFYRDPEDSLVTYNVMFSSDFGRELSLNFSDFNNNTLYMFFYSILNSDSPAESLELNAQEQIEFEEILGKILKEYDNKKEGFLQFIKGYMIILLTMIPRFINLRSSPGPSGKTNLKIIKEIIGYLDKNYTSPVSLNELAVISFYSKNYLCTLFKDATGITITQYIQELRIKHAVQLLETTDYKLTDISEIVGFSDYKLFKSCFKKITGVAVKDYRTP